MKSLSRLLALLLLLGIAMTACNKDEDETPTVVTPNINFVGGAGYTSDDASMTVGAQFKVGINATPNASSGSKLSKFTVTRTFNNVPFTVLDSTLSSLSTFSIDMIAYANNAVGSERWSFKITDKAGEYKELSFNITTTASAGNINTYTAVLMGGQGNTTVGSYYATTDNIVMLQAQAVVNQGAIDFVYFYGSQNLATLAAPDDPTVGGGSGNLTLCENWTTKNATRFVATSILPADFDAITDDAAIVAAAASANLSKANLLDVDDVIAFKTEAGKLGLIKVSQLVTGDTGTITITVKIQQ
jgi:hypothetical protein